MQFIISKCFLNTSPLAWVYMALKKISQNAQKYILTEFYLIPLKEKKTK